MHPLVTDIGNGSVKSLARAITLVENKSGDYMNILEDCVSASPSAIIGLTGPPGAGKSTLADALIRLMVQHDKKIGVLCVDPSSPFNLGALLGDRIRMSEWYNHPNVFIRSLATRGSLGGLHPSIIEITDVMKSFGFDYIIVETVGVGQSEVEIAGLADTTVVVLVPEGGDEVQSMKAGLMEIADIFVVNKSDRPGADIFMKYLLQMLSPPYYNRGVEIPVLKTIASQNVGLDMLLQKIEEHNAQSGKPDKRFWLLAEKAYHIIRHSRMENVDKAMLKSEIEKESSKERINFYSFIRSKQQGE